jgi:hypothetical protein
MRIGLLGMLIIDILVDVKFYEVNFDGRKTPTPNDFSGCLFLSDGEKHDCRLLLKKIGAICPGDFKKNVPIKFLCPELVMPKLFEGKNFYLWELRNIGEGQIVKIINKTSSIRKI